MKKYIDKIPDECPRCHEKLEATNDFVEGGIISKIVCENCGYEIDWYFESSEEVQKNFEEEREELEKFLKENSR